MKKLLIALLLFSATVHGQVKDFITRNGVIVQMRKYDSTAVWGALGSKLSSIDTTNILNFHLKVKSLFSGSSGITYNSTTGAITIANDDISYAKLQNISATNRFIGRITPGAGDAEELTGTQATSLLDIFTTSVKGLVPAATGGNTTTQFLRKDGTWVVPTGSSGVTGIDPINSQTKSANGAVVNGSNLVLQTVDGTYPGLMTSASKARLDSNFYIITPVTGVQNAYQLNDSTLRIKSLVGSTNISVTNNNDSTNTIDITGTLSNNTTGSAASLTTGRTISGTGDATFTTGSFNGTANVTGAVTVVKINGTTMSALGTGVLKNTTGTGVPSIAVNSDLPVMSATVGGAVPTPPNDASKFLNGTGAFTVPAGGGDMVLASAQTVTGAKTFNDTKLLMRNVANTFNGSFTNTNTSDRVYTLKDAAGTIAFTSDITGTNSGTNTGDQTITLTSDVTGTGTGSFATTIAAGAVTLSKMANMATSSLIYRKTAGSGAPEVNTLAALKTDLGLTGTNSGDQTSVTGNAGTATALATGRTIAITGDLTYTSPSFDGTGNVTAAGTLATVNSNTGSFGSATQTGTFTVNGKGLITAASNTTITPAESSVTFTDITTGDFSTTKHGFVPKGTNTGKFLKDDGTWATVSGSGTVTATGGALTSNSLVLGNGTTDTKVVAGLTTDGVSVIIHGVANTTAGKSKYFGGTSGDATIQTAAAAGTATIITLPNASSTLPIYPQQMTFTGMTAARTVTFPDASFTAARTDAANTFTGTQTFSSTISGSIDGNAATVTTNANLTGDVTSSGNATTIVAPSSTTVNNNTGGWVTFKVSGSDVTTTGQTLVDITGLVTGTLSVSSKYEIEAMLMVATSAVATGTEYGVNCTGTGTAQGILYMGPSTVTASVQVLNETGTNGNNVAETPAFLTTNSETGTIWIHGYVETGTGSPTIAIRHLKVTSGTSTVKIGSTLRIRKL